MNKIKIILATITMLVMVLCIGSTFAQTQSQLNQEAGEAYQIADKQLNNVYKQILSEYAADITFINNLKSTQRIWIKFRDAEVKMKYPESKSAGSAEPMCRALYLEELTNSRIKTLKIWTDGVEEGDICNGSVKIK